MHRGIYQVAETYGEDGGEPNTSPWVWKAGGQHFFWLALQTVGAHCHSIGTMPLVEGTYTSYRSPSPGACHRALWGEGSTSTALQLIWGYQRLRQIVNWSTPPS